MLLSIALILIVGLILGFIFERLNLPSLLGMLLAGIILGPSGYGLLSQELMGISQEIRELALIIILLRAGLGISKETLKKIGKTAFKLSFIPGLLEGAAIFLIATHIFKLNWQSAGMLAFIIAAVSPAVIVPSMLQLIEKKLGKDKEVPTLVLAGASIDDVFAITIFSIFLGLFKSGEVQIFSILTEIPIKIIGGVLLGLIIGYLLEKFFRRYNKLNLSYQTIILMVVAIFTTILGDYLGVASLLGLMTIGYWLLEKNKEVATNLSLALNKLWIPAKIFLFVLIGAAVKVQVALHAGWLGILLIFLGLIARSIGVLISTTNSYLNFKERVFCVIAYIPKATVQAAIGAVPLANGVPNGELILALAVMSIILTAPLGAIGIDYFAPKLLSQPQSN
ncbi:sodium/proton antiporter (CPA1 family) [Orenia metallireducens]|uniref:Sodium/proton antiporter, CPA1 family n=1 Tax=Orenia metallireducens TaxID=1413210 RepID=A0A285H0D6_9FIRM|nr:cation:proton antiporter [Orenia metallireducens]PRX21786.1 sodium/proton antiporter (CPA1 family) [Orenia metallireducens]SNY29014.1 sodium/proton antiporter, CPA1 family [Orenia metallireducens]